MASVIDAALEYATAYGWPVIPLHSPKDGKCDCRRDDCDSPAKHPRVMHGLKAASTAPAQIREWWSMWPLANLGIVTGERSNLAVLDIDDRHGGSDTLTALIAEHAIGGIELATLACHTGSDGMHIYFRLPPDTPLRNSAGALGPGLDVRAIGGYCVAPPSMHICGQRYRWGVNGPDTADLLPLPAKLIPLLTPKARAMTGPIPEAEPILEGRRDGVLASFAGTLRNMGEGPAEIEEHLAIFNKRCNPPKAPDDLHRIACSIGRYRVKEDPCKLRRPVWETFPPEVRQWA